MKTIQKFTLLLFFCLSSVYLTHGQNFPPPKYFDWEKTNAERFVNSPCLRDIGFNPDRDPIEQERMFRECEEEKRNKKIGNFFATAGQVILVILGILAFLFGLITPRRRRYY